jgi:hypothetical protein
VRLGLALCMECQLGSTWQPLPAQPPTESELIALSRRYLSTDGPQNPPNIVPSNSSTGCKRFAVGTKRYLVCQRLWAHHWLQ